MSQNADESCQSWLIRLRSAAPDCEYVCPTLSCRTDLTDMHIRDQFIIGLQNKQIQQDILAKAEALPTLHQVVKHAEFMETATRDQARLTPSFTPSPYNSEDVSRISDYRRNKRNQPSNRPRDPGTTRPHPRPKHLTQLKLCNGCGSSSHTSLERHIKCPAWNQTCNNCGKFNHFANVCRSEKAEVAAAIIAHATIPSTDQPPPNEEIEATLTTLLQPQHKTKLTVYPDSGATVCIAGPQHLHHLNIQSHQLHSTNKRIGGVGGRTIHCYGWIPIRFEIGGFQSKQSLYICHNVKRIYLSNPGCRELNILPKTFPHPMPPSPTAVAAVSTAADPKPTTNHVQQGNSRTLPFPATKENIPKLKQWLIDHFARTTFNNDKTTYFPKMTGVPKAHIHLKPDAKPFARHTPNTVPIAWKPAVEALLKSQSQRRIIAKSPPGTTAVWCSPLVVTPKKSYNPSDALPDLCMTVDLQRLNSQCIRETHHCESPFTLVSQVPPNTYKTVLDAVDRYQAIDLDEES